MFFFVLVATLFLLASAAPITTIHFVLHSHDDLGWLKTFDEYQWGLNNSIQNAAVDLQLTSIIQSLSLHPERKFSQVEMGFFSRWWVQQSVSMQELVRQLVRNGQLSFINGGWCMHDEASAHFADMWTQTIEGHSFLHQAFGREVLPQVGWQIDPFGHTAGNVQLLSQDAGYFATIHSRMDYRDFSFQQNRQAREFVWAPSPTRGGAASVLASSMLHSTYCPPILFNFDTTLPSSTAAGPTATPSSTSAAAAANTIDWLADEILALVASDLRVSRYGHILVPLGCDFTGQGAEKWFLSADNLIRVINHKYNNTSHSSSSTRVQSSSSTTTSGSSVRSASLPFSHRIAAQYSTPEDYFNALIQAASGAASSGSKKRKKSSSSYSFQNSNSSSTTSTSQPWFARRFEDSVPYADAPFSVWSGHYTSRPNYKRSMRVASQTVFKSTRQLFAAASVSLLPQGSQPSGMGGSSSTSSSPFSFSRCTNNCFPMLAPSLSSTAAQCALQSFSEAISTGQHHDAITGTAKQHVAFDYVRQLSIGVDLGSMLSAECILWLHQQLPDYRALYRAVYSLLLDLNVLSDEQRGEEPQKQSQKVIKEGRGVSSSSSSSSSATSAPVFLKYCPLLNESYCDVTRWWWEQSQPQSPAGGSNNGTSSSPFTFSTALSLVIAAYNPSMQWKVGEKLVIPSILFQEVTVVQYSCGADATTAGEEEDDDDSSSSSSSTSGSAREHGDGSDEQCVSYLPDFMLVPTHQSSGAQQASGGGGGFDLIMTPILAPLQTTTIVVTPLSRRTGTYPHSPQQQHYAQPHPLQQSQRRQQQQPQEPVSQPPPSPFTFITEALTVEFTSDGKWLKRIATRLPSQQAEEEQERSVTFAFCWYAASNGTFSDSSSSSSNSSNRGSVPERRSAVHQAAGAYILRTETPNCHALYPSAVQQVVAATSSAAGTVDGIAPFLVVRQQWYFDPTEVPSFSHSDGSSSSSHSEGGDSTTTSTSAEAALVTLTMYIPQSIPASSNGNNIGNTSRSSSSSSSSSRSTVGVGTTIVPWIELEWSIGDIPISDGVGKELALRIVTAATTSSLSTNTLYYESTNTNHSNVMGDAEVKGKGTVDNDEEAFYTDSNGLEMIRRVRNTRSAFPYRPVEGNEVAENYYPCTTAVLVRKEEEKSSTSPSTSSSGSHQLTVLLDGAVGCTRPQAALLGTPSLLSILRLSSHKQQQQQSMRTSGSSGGSTITILPVEILLQRRLLEDDQRGVGEPLNETEFIEPYLDCERRKKFCAFASSLSSPSSSTTISSPSSSSTAATGNVIGNVCQRPCGAHYGAATRVTGRTLFTVFQPPVPVVMPESSFSSSSSLPSSPPSPSTADTRNTSAASTTTTSRSHWLNWWRGKAVSALQEAPLVLFGLSTTSAISASTQRKAALATGFSFRKMSGGSSHGNDPLLHGKDSKASSRSISSRSRMMPPPQQHSPVPPTAAQRRRQQPQLPSTWPSMANNFFAPQTNEVDGNSGIRLVSFERVFPNVRVNVSNAAATPSPYACSSSSSPSSSTTSSSQEEGPSLSTNTNELTFRLLLVNENSCALTAMRAQPFSFENWLYQQRNISSEAYYNSSCSELEWRQLSRQVNLTQLAVFLLVLPQNDNKQQQTQSPGIRLCSPSTTATPSSALRPCLQIERRMLLDTDEYGSSRHVGMVEKVMALQGLSSSSSSSATSSSSSRNSVLQAWYQTVLNWQPSTNGSSESGSTTERAAGSERLQLSGVLTLAPMEFATVRLVLFR